MNIEHDVRMIPMLPVEKFQEEVNKLASDGWEIVQGVPPVAIYHIVRDKDKVQAASMQVRMGIDDTKIGILRDGKLVQ